MQRYGDRENYGPEFDDRLIQLVRSNPAIYDVNHPHYRRNPVRVAIWDRIANELQAPSKFLQTKWKNIRYNYLQEVKSLETGQANANIRKRRFTEDLSFLQNTAQTYNVKKGLYKNSSYNSSDNDSNSYMHPDSGTQNAFEVIEIEHSDDGSQQMYDSHNIEDFANSVDDLQSKWMADHTADVKHATDPTPDVTIEQTSPQRKVNAKYEENTSPAHSSHSSPSPLLTPLVVMGNGRENNTNGEVTIEPISKSNQQRPRIPPSEIMSNAAKRKAMSAPYPVLTPINDPIELYCLSLVDSLRNMPRSERERVKFEFANILKDAKYKDQS